MNNPQFPTARKSGLVIQEIPNEVLVYDLETNKAHCLNNTASIVWKACDGRNSISDIAAIVGTEAGSKISDDLVWLAIDQLNENNLLESEMKVSFSGESRRNAIKKIGLASMVALPIIASLTAPKSAMASVSCQCQNPGTNNDSTCAPGCGANCDAIGVCTNVTQTIEVQKFRKGS